LKNSRYTYNKRTTIGNNKNIKPKQKSMAKRLECPIKNVKPKSKSSKMDFCVTGLCSLCKSMFPEAYEKKGKNTRRHFIGWDRSICSSCFEKSGGGFYEIEIRTQIDTNTVNLQLYIIPYKILESRNVLLEKNKNDRDVSLVKIAIKHGIQPTESLMYTLS